MANTWTDDAVKRFVESCTDAVGLVNVRMRNVVYYKPCEEIAVQDLCDAPVQHNDNHLSAKYLCPLTCLLEECDFGGGDAALLNDDVNLILSDISSMQNEVYHEKQSLDMIMGEKVSGDSDVKRNEDELDVMLEAIEDAEQTIGLEKEKLKEALIAGGYDPTKTYVDLTTVKPTGSPTTGPPVSAPSTEVGNRPPPLEFPAECDWECYYDRHPDFQISGLPREEQAVKNHYMLHGHEEDRDCSCPEKPAEEEPQPEAQVDDDDDYDYDYYDDKPYIVDDGNWSEAIDPDSGDPYYYNGDDKTWDKPVCEEADTTKCSDFNRPATVVDDGNWSEAVDPDSGNKYYYRNDGSEERTWVKPVCDEADTQKCSEFNRADGADDDGDYYYDYDDAITTTDEEVTDKKIEDNEAVVEDEDEEEGDYSYDDDDDDALILPGNKMDPNIDDFVENMLMEAIDEKAKAEQRLNDYQTKMEDLMDRAEQSGEDPSRIQDLVDPSVQESLVRDVVTKEKKTKLLEQIRQDKIEYGNAKQKVEDLTEQNDELILSGTPIPESLEQEIVSHIEEQDKIEERIKAAEDELESLLENEESNPGGGGSEQSPEVPTTTNENPDPGAASMDIDPEEIDGMIAKIVEEEQKLANEESRLHQILDEHLDNSTPGDDLSKITYYQDTIEKIRQKEQELEREMDRLQEIVNANNNNGGAGDGGTGDDNEDYYYDYVDDDEEPKKENEPIVDDGNWRMAIDPDSGAPYYYNKELDQTTWDKPVCSETDTTKCSRFNRINGGNNNQNENNEDENVAEDYYYDYDYTFDAPPVPKDEVIPYVEGNDSPPKIASSNSVAGLSSSSNSAAVKSHPAFVPTVTAIVVFAVVFIAVFAWKKLTVRKGRSADPKMASGSFNIRDSYRDTGEDGTGTGEDAFQDEEYYNDRPRQSYDDISTVGGGSYKDEVFTMDGGGGGGNTPPPEDTFGILKNIAGDSVSSTNQPPPRHAEIKDTFGIMGGIANDSVTNTNQPPPKHAEIETNVV